MSRGSPPPIAPSPAPEDSCVNDDRNQGVPRISSLLADQPPHPKRSVSLSRRTSRSVSDPFEFILRAVVREDGRLKDESGHETIQDIVSGERHKPTRDTTGCSVLNAWQPDRKAPVLWQNSTWSAMVGKIPRGHARLLSSRPFPTWNIAPSTCRRLGRFSRVTRIRGKAAIS